MKILVTGGNGFVGKHVVAALIENGHVVETPRHFDLDLVRPGITHVNHHDNPDRSYVATGASHIAEYMHWKKVEGVVHLAAICGGIGINKDNPGKFMYENLQMGLNVIEACRLAGNIKKLVNLSTVCSYPKNTPVPFRESDLWNGYPEETNAPYGIAKKAVMELGIAYNKQYGLNVTNLVPVNMAGEYDHFDLYSSHVLPALIRKFEEAKDVVTLWGTGSASREFLYAGDCARAIAVAVEKDTGPQPINLGTGQEITIKELAETVKQIGGYSAAIVWDHSKPDGQPRRCLDVSRAKNVLRWEATTSIQDTVSKTIKWYRENK
jgi:nucleoside-diphosphate-sugar epimerase